MTPEILWLEDTLKHLSAVGAMLTPPLYGAWRLVVRPKVVAPIQSHITEMRSLQATVERIAPKVDVMSDALGPNGGSSLADSIRRSESRQMLMMHTLPWPTWEADATGANTTVNVAFERMFQYSAEDLRGNGWKALIHHEDADEYLRAWSFAVKDRRDFTYGDVRFVSADRKAWRVSVTAYLACSRVMAGNACARCESPTCIWMGTVQVRGMEMQ